MWALWAVAGTAVALVVLGEVVIPVPGLLPFLGLAVPIALVAPLAISTVLGAGLAGGDELLETVGSRPIALLDAAFVSGVTTAALSIFTLLDVLGATDLGTAAGRDAYGYVGLMLIGLRFFGPHAAAAVPAAVVVGTTVFGGSPTGHPQWWAWILADADDALSWALALSLMAAGVALLVTRRSAIPSRSA